MDTVASMLLSELCEVSLARNAENTRMVRTSLTG